jgi:hypothetical protein
MHDRLHHGPYRLRASQRRVLLGDPRGLEIIVEQMIEKAFRRRGRKGALCRKLSSSEGAFLTEICRIAVKGR